MKHDLKNIWAFIGELSFRDLREMAQQIADSADGKVPSDVYHLADLLAEISENVADE